MKRLLILILILLGLFFVFFYFSLGSQPELAGEYDGKNPPLTTSLDSIMQLNPKYKAQYVYVKGAGYVLKDRRIVLLVGQDTAQNRKADAIKRVEKELESYWKWQILTGKKNIEDLTEQTNQVYEDKSPNVENPTKKNIFSRILDVFKVADAVNVFPDTNKTCDCDKNLLLLAGKGLHLIETTLNPGSGGIGGRTPKGETASGGSHLKQTKQEYEQGDGKSYENSSFLVGIIDSGINPESFIGSMNHPLNYNFLDKSNNIKDTNPVMHGTKIARIITMRTNSRGFSIVGLKAYDENNVGNLYDNLCAILYAVKNNMKVVNASWGASSKEPIPVFEEVLRRAKAANMVVVASAGNKSEDIDLNPYYPACYADHSEFGNYVITVTSRNQDANDKETVCKNFSSSGKKIDLTMRANELCNHGIPDKNGLGASATMENGTSYATPYATADVIKYLLKNPSGFSKSGFVGSIPQGGDIRKY
jgi:subtilisin family serine protease